MDGILIIDKPAGLTSHDVVSRVRRALNTRRVGHTGTLDPFATGVLVVMVGKATRLARFIDKDEKEYEAVVQFGWETDTGDRTGNAEDGTRRLGSDVERILAATDWERVLREFRGDILQTPPMYSAKKVGGKKLYELARKGETVTREPAKVFIKELELLSGEGSLQRIRVVCSAGTYIRTLAEDIGRVIGTGAHLSELRRTRAGRFSIGNATSLELLRQMDDPAAVLLPIDEAVGHLPQVTVSTDRAAKAKEGLSTRVADAAFAHSEFVRIVDDAANLIAIGLYDDAEKSVKPKIVLV